MNLKLLILSALALVIFGSVHSQNEDKTYEQDVKTIPAIIDAYYDVISGKSTDAWQYERDSYLHSAKALITRLDDNGYADTFTLEAEYVPILLQPKEDFYEIEIKRTVSQFGNMAQVWSAYEIRTDPEISINIRGLNSIQLHFEDGRWFIDSWTTQMETENNSTVADFMKM